MTSQEIDHACGSGPVATMVTVACRFNERALSILSKCNPARARPATGPPAHPHGWSIDP
jgi:hypothetical protein